MYEESRSTPFTWLLGIGAAVQLVLMIWIPEARWILASAAVLLALLGWAGSRYFVRFDGETLHFGFRHWNKLLQRGAIESVRIEHIGLWTFGGFGWRLRPGKIAYVRWAGPAVAIRTPEREYWLSCEHPEKLCEALLGAGISASGTNV